MCGITGIFSQEIIDRATLESMTDAVKHRGPDAHGIFLDPTKTIGLGHRRLSIIDLSTEANQPFHSKNGRYIVVFNGEIYNFQQLRRELETGHGVVFRTHSDTEVILESFILWGPGMVEKLEGMFALAIADTEEHKLFLFRDRLGKKPLYYFQSNGLFAFASEIKSLLKHPLVSKNRQINKSALSSFLHLGFIPAPETVYSSIRKFPAGHFGEIGRSWALTTTPYWRLENYFEGRGRNTRSQSIAGLTTLLDDAVRIRLISDVPLGAFLSGGTDSSLVCAVASKQVSRPLKTFSIGFKDSRFDETRYARAVADHLKTDHTEYILTEKEAVDKVDAYLRHFDEPFADTSSIPTLLVSKLARQEVKAVLTGDGGDELFQGYGSYRWAARLDKLSWKIMRRPVAFALKASGRNRWERVSRLMEEPGTGGSHSHIFSQEQYYFTQDEIHGLLMKNPSDFKPFEYSSAMPPGHHLTAAEQQALFDLRFYLPDDLLEKVDRASMYYGLECRCPLLDHRIVEYALALDERVKHHNGTSKWIEKELLRPYLPKDLVDRPKWGFSVPLSSWMKGDLSFLLDEFLSDAVIEEVGLCNTAFVRGLKTKFEGGKDYLYHRLWALIVLHKWMKENG